MRMTTTMSTIESCHPSALSQGLVGGKEIRAQYTIPVGLSLGLEDHKQGTLVVFNLDADININMLISIFEAFEPCSGNIETSF